MVQEEFEKYFYQWSSSHDKLSLYKRLLEWQGDIFISFDPGVVGFSGIDNLHLLYSTQENISLDELVTVRPFDHTMGESLDEYVKQKLPINEIKKVLLRGGKIKVLNIYPKHFSKVAKFLELHDFHDVEFEHNPYAKKLNFIRPSYLINKNEDTLLVLVTPGRDYLLHYASLINHAIAFFTRYVGRHLEIIRFPFVEFSLPFWTQLDNSFIKEDEVVIIGYVEEFRNFLKYKKVLILDSTENEYYSVCKIRFGSQTVSLLGVKYSFWGNISARLVYHCCNMGIKEVVYFGKLGTLEGEDNIYSKIYSPSKFCIFYHEKLIAFIKELPNRFLEHAPKYDTGTHVSVPSVLEEDYIQRKIITDLSISSIDNEISQIAYAILKYNTNYKRDVAFSCLHFATDYLRQLDKRGVETPHDLSNNRTQTALAKKEQMINKISEILYDYLSKTYV